MNKAQRLGALLAHGYFPEELPPPFNTLDLAKHRNHVIAAWAAIPGDYPKTTPEAYSNPRIRRIRRNLALVNPIAQVHLSKLICNNWAVIRKHLKKSKYALELPEVQLDKDRAVPKPDFSLVALRRIEIASLHDHALISDISRFYGTLYTHAIAWALHGKAWSKLNLNTPAFKSSLGNQLDIAVRKGQDNQTIGIPIGPDTSRILSEIIAASIDTHVERTLSLGSARAFRHVDDWHIGFDNAGEAEDAIATLAAACREYELELNAEKTRSMHAGSVVDGIWATELRQFHFDTSVGSQAKGIEHFFAKTFQFAADFPEQNVLSYAVKRTKSLRVQPDNWRMYESFLLKAVRANPTVTPDVVEILVSYNHNKYSIDRPRISKLIADLVHKNAPLAHHAEVAWALFLAKGLKIKLARKSAQAVSTLESSTCALLALDLRRSGLIEGKLDTSLWEQSMTQDGLKSNMWLLAYEADLKGWLQDNPVNFVDSDPYFSILKKKMISFYDVKKNVTHITKQKPRPPSSALLNYLALHRLSRLHIPVAADVPYY